MTLISAPSWTGSTTGTLVYAYPLSSTYPIAQWLTHRVALTESEGAWAISLDNSKGLFWGLFEGTTQPTSKNESVATVSLEENTLPSGLTVAVPSTLENAGFDPTAQVKYRGTTWYVVVNELGVIDNISQAWFTLRKRNSDNDTESIAQVALYGGLLVSNGVSVGLTSSNGTLTVTDASTTGTVTVMISVAETINYPVMNNLHYDIKVKRNNGDVDLVHLSNKFSIVQEVTRKIT